MSVPLAAPRGLREAAAKSEFVVEPLSDGSVRVGAATVARSEGVLSCDCPMGDMPFCLHRLIALGVPERPQAQSLPPPSSPGPWRREGERLPAEDLVRFQPILDEISALISTILTLGLRRGSKVLSVRLERALLLALSLRPRPSAPREAGFGRVTRSLERLSASLPALEGPDPGRAETRALAELAVLRNLIRALRANTGKLPLADIAGASRSEYIEISSLEVQGLGLEAWGIASDTFGLSAYLAVLGTNRILVRSVLAKGKTNEGQPGRLPLAWAERAARGPAFAHGSVTMRDLAHGRFALSGARFAPSTGRLSGSGTTSAASRPTLPLDDELLRPFVLSNATSAVRLAELLTFDPLGRPPPTQSLVLLPVRSLSPSDFDASTQRLSLRIRTQGGATLPTTLPFREERSLYFDNIEILSRAARPPAWLFVRLGRDGGELVVEPITALMPELGVLDLSVDKLGPELEQA